MPLLLAPQTRSLSESVKSAFPELDWKEFDNGKTIQGDDCNFTQVGDRFIFRSWGFRPTNTGYTAMKPGYHIERTTPEELIARVQCVIASHRTISEQEWLTEGERLFGRNKLNWRFVCPHCGYVASAQDYLEAGAEDREVGFNCIGRHYSDARPHGDCGQPGYCTYSGASGYNPITILKPVKSHHEQHTIFEFARG